MLDFYNDADENDADEDFQADFVDMAVKLGGLSPGFMAKFQPGTFAKTGRVTKAVRSKGAKPRRIKGSRRAPRRHAVQRAGAESGDSGGDGEPPEPPEPSEPPPSLTWEPDPSPSVKQPKSCSVHDFAAMVYSLGEEPLRSLHPDGTRLGNLLRLFLQPNLAGPASRRRSRRRPAPPRNGWTARLARLP